MSDDEVVARPGCSRQPKSHWELAQSARATDLGGGLRAGHHGGSRSTTRPARLQPPEVERFSSAEVDGFRRNGRRTIPQRITDALQESGRDGLHLTDLARRVGTTVLTISVALASMNRDGTVRRVGKGRYVLGAER